MICFQFPSVSPALRRLLNAILLATAGLNIQPVDSQELAWNLKPGDQFEVILTQEKQAQTTVEKRVVKNNSQTQIRQHWDVEAADEKGNFRIQQTIQSIKLSVENPELPSQALNVDTDSTVKASRESAKVLGQIRPLLGLEFVVTLSPRGEILGVTYSDEAKQVLQALPGSLDLQALFTPEGIRDLLGGAAIVFPEKSPTEGQQWEVSDELINPLGNFKRTRVYRFAELREKNDEPVAVIALTTSIEPESLNLANGKLNSFSESGELSVDLSRGIVRSSQTRSVTSAETEYLEIAVATTIESTNTVTINTR